MRIKLNTEESDLNKFASKEWEKALGFLHKSFGLSRDDCQDVFQNSFIVLYEKAIDGSLENLSCSLSTYFMSICRNKAHEMMRDIQKLSVVDDETSLSLMDGEFKKDKLNAIIDTSGESFEDDKQEMVNKIVQDLPSPCNELLWGFYRDELSLKTLAAMLNYTEGAIKVIKHRCCEKFRIRYQSVIKSLF